MDNLNKIYEAGVVEKAINREQYKDETVEIEIFRTTGTSITGRARVFIS